MTRKDAVVFTNGLLHVDFAKTCHGLLRGSDRFRVLGVVDEVHAGKDAGEVMDGNFLGVPVYPSLADFLCSNEKPPVLVVGVAFSGGGQGSARWGRRGRGSCPQGSQDVSLP